MAAAEVNAELSAAKDELVQEGRRIVGEAKDEARRFADERKGAAAGVLRDVSDAVSAASNEIRQKGHNRTAACVDFAAHEVGLLARQLDQQSLGTLVDDVTSFARRRPGLFYGASLLAGFAAIRFLKSRSDHAE